ncbi:glycosyltransferase family 2 protein [Planktothrix sp. FACHB-1355]|uniref:Glycosyltransferase family 2 protein n=1 Tax=Aerosakkonema funiforme FACHB-1375 TaxID=2949571 RepID=A0A926VBE0_9CYAN|nr:MULTISPECIES: glycosyltransferase family 2 protein [Oscillatoriales]MBD2180671.1 glycosyltransferase family 2 protein [Aerosakkonema funiforme FACHB-1375]MBD3561621.1 glycosyltransferase family 2 protein [Planktothrix sp. FACHB-1355]
MPPLVSIVVTCFNQDRYLEKSVKSVLNQTFIDLECLIVDDGSTDNTREVVENLMRLDSRIKYFYKENGGVSSARNFGFRQAQGEWIQFLDGDDWIDDRKTEFQLNHLKGVDRQNTVFYCDYERVFLDGEQNITDRQSNIVGDLTKEQLIQRLLIPDFLADSPFPLLQQCLLMNRSIFSKKMFDESLKALQDRDFTLDLALAGVNFIYTPIVGAFYTKHRTNRTNKWSYMKGYYILFYETIYSKHKDLLPLCESGINFLVQDTIREKDKDNFERLMKIIRSPVYFLDKKVKVNNATLLKLLYSLRSFVPSFILYQKYRGPRSQKILSLLSPLFNLTKSSKDNVYL